ncbi:MAG: hypothetical protein HY901_29590 [Deltaproteobacteria bacterium]|nr:hypothetical protein [Deltaproteobacteria bacterium]
MRLARVVIASVVFTVSGTAVAGEPTEQPDQPQPAPASWLLAAKLGGTFPGIFGALSASPAAELEAGYFLGPRLLVDAAVAYSQPGHEATVADPRVSSGSYSFSLVQRDLAFFAGSKLLFPIEASDLTPYASAGLRLHLVEQVVDGQAGGSAFGETREQGTSWGASLRGGAGWSLGPGSLVGELELSWAAMERSVSGESDLAALGLSVGYQLAL